MFVNRPHTFSFSCYLMEFRTFDTELKIFLLHLYLWTTNEKAFSSTLRFCAKHKLPTPRVSSWLFSIPSFLKFIFRSSIGASGTQSPSSFAVQAEDFHFQIQDCSTDRLGMFLIDFDPLNNFTFSLSVVLNSVFACVFPFDCDCSSRAFGFWS